MKKFLSIFVCGLLFLSCSKPKEDTATKAYLAQYSDQNKPLEIDYVSPTGEVDRGTNKFVVHFTQPMIPLAALGKPDTGPELLEISPKLVGHYKWVNTKTLTYEVEGDLPFATDFQIKVSAGKESLLGFALLKDFTFEFRTPEPRVTQIVPQDNSINVDIQGPFRVFFNQPVKEQNMASFLELKSENKKSEFPITVACAEVKSADKKSGCSEFLIRPAKLLPTSTPIRLAVKAGIFAEQGPKVLANTASAGFETYGEFKITGLSCTEDCMPNTGFSLRSSTPLDFEAIADQIKVDPPLKNKLSESGGYWSDEFSNLSVYANLRAATKYTITVPKGTKDIFGQKLAADATFQMTTGHLGSVFHMPMVQEQVLVNRPELDFGVWGTNLSSVTARYNKKMSDAELIALVEGYGENLVEQVNDSTFWDVSKIVSGQTKDKPEHFPIGAKDVLGHSSSGIILCEYDSPDVMQDQTDDEGIVTKVPAPQWVVREITDLAIHTKFSAGQKGLAWVTSLNDGTDVAGAKITIYSSQGQALYTGTTDSRGLLELPSRQNLWTAWEKISPEVERKSYGRSFYIFAQKGDDRSYMANDWNEGIIDYSYYDWSQEATEPDLTVRAHLLTDRGLYKPSEKVYIKGYLRTWDDSGLAPYNGSLILVIHDPRGKNIANIPVTPNSRGNFSASLDLPAKAPLGSYSANLRMPDLSQVKSNSDVVFDGDSLYFQVLQFRTPEFKITTTAAQVAYFTGDKASVTVDGQYLFGAPMKFGRVSSSVRPERSYFYPDLGDDYSWQFGRLYEHSDDDGSKFSSAGSDVEGKLDDKGQTQISFPTMKDVLDPVAYNIESEVFDVSGQSQADSYSVLVHPADFYVGAKTDKFFIDENQPIGVQFKTWTTDGKASENHDIKGELYRVSWVSVKKETLTGEFETESTRQENKIAECSQHVSAAPVSCSFPGQTGGYYFVRLAGKDSKGRIAMTELPIYITGGGEPSWAGVDSNVLELVPDKKIYQAGDVAKVLIKSPFAKAQALITTERSGILTVQRKELVGGAPVLEFPIDAKSAPNFFVRVALVKGARELDPNQNVAAGAFDDALVKVGTLDIPVEPQGKVLSVTVTPDKKIYQPRETVKLDFQVNGMADQGGAELTVMVVDEGVLMAGGYTLRNPLDTFFQEYNLGSSMADTRTKFVGKQGLEGKLASASAGGGAMSNYRQHFIPIAYFNGAVDTTPDGKASVSFDLPDSLTTFRVMVIANAANDQFGLVKSEFKTQKAIMLRPALPRFVRLGDSFTSGAVLHNNTDQDLSVTVKIEADGVTLTSGGDAKVNVPAHGSSYQVAHFLADPKILKAKFLAEGRDPQNGQAAPILAQVRFVAQGGNEEDRVVITLPIRFDRTIETVATSGVSNGSVSEYFEKSPDTDPDFGSLHVALSGQLRSRLSQTIHLLRIYPYDCLEQKLSKNMPLVLFADENDFFQGDERDPDVRREKIESFIDELQANQSYFGEFRLWPTSQRTSPSLTLEAAEFLAHAKAAGFGTSVSGMLDLIRKRLPMYLKGTDYYLQNYPESYRRELAVNALYVLYLMGEPQPSYYSVYQPIWQELEPVTQARLAEMIHADNPSAPFVQTWKQDLGNRLRLKGEIAYAEPSAYSSGYYFGENTRVSSARVLDSLLKIDPGHPLIFPLLRGVVESKSKGDYWSSLDLTSTLLALRQYRVTFPTADQDVVAKLSLNSTNVLSTTLTRAKPNDELDLPVAKLPEKVHLELKKDSGGPLFYNLSYQYLMKSERPYGLEQGIVLSREIHDLSGKLVDPGALKKGETYRIVTNFYFDDQTDDLAVELPVPAGLEPVNANILTERSSLREATRASGTFAWYLQHREFRDQVVQLFGDNIPRGFAEFAFYARATNSGTFELPPAMAREMYHPEVFGTTGGLTVVVSE